MTVMNYSSLNYNLFVSNRVFVLWACCGDEARAHYTEGVGTESRWSGSQGQSGEET